MVYYTFTTEVSLERYSLEPLKSLNFIPIFNLLIDCYYANMWIL